MFYFINIFLTTVMMNTKLMFCVVLTQFNPGKDKGLEKEKQFQFSGVSFPGGLWRRLQT